MAQDPELVGHVIGGKYRLVRHVSDGRLKVYEARHERLAGRFAVTLWPTTTPWDAFQRGAELAMTLRHPGVVQVIDFNCQPGSSPFLVLEWIEGARLSDLVAEAGLLPIERVAPLIESAAWALASAHQQGIVHQELRPSDLFVVHAAGTMREWVKLGGFGVRAAVARVRRPPPSRYRAPEQLAIERDDRPNDDAEADGADPQSDQYALAAIAYEMLAGVPPFDEERTQPEPLPISELAPGVSAAIDAAIRQALSAEPEQRFPGVLEFARALRAGVDGASPEAVLRHREQDETGKGKRRRRMREVVSPFFNPVQGAGEAFRRVATTTARLRTVAGARLARLSNGPVLVRRASTRIALAGGALLLAFSGAAVLLKRAPRRMEVTTPTVAMVPAPPSAVPASPPEPSVLPIVSPVASGAPAVTPLAAPTTPPVARSPVAGPSTAHEAIDPGAPKNTDSRAAWARLASTAGTRMRGTAGRGGSAPKLTPARPKSTAVAKSGPVRAAASAAAGNGPCVLSVGSRPPAEVWVDERSVGQRTPLAGYHLACGDHKLVLKRSDLDIYQMEIITLSAGTPFKKFYPLQ